MESAPDNALLPGQERHENGRFAKGRSGNPTGRPAVPEDVKEMLRAATIPAVQLLINTMNDDEIKPELRVKCAELIIERTLGRPTQLIVADVTTSAIDWGEITTEELRRLAAYEGDDSERGET